jgi:hypothetical protein
MYGHSGMVAEGCHETAGIIPVISVSGPPEIEDTVAVHEAYLRRDRASFDAHHLSSLSGLSDRLR